MILSNTTEIKAWIYAARAAIDANLNLKASIAVHQFSALYQSLLGRQAGMPPSNSRGGHNKKLNSEQYLASQDYIFMLYSCRTPANTKEVLLAANRLLYYLTRDSEKAVSIR